MSTLSPEWTWASWTVFPGSKAILIVTVVFCAVIAEETAVPSVRTATLLSTADLAQAGGQEETPSYLYPWLFPQWPVSEALVEGGDSTTTRIAENAESGSWVLPAKSQPRLPLSITPHNTEGLLTQRTVSPRLSQHTNWKARFIREHCSCSQKVCLESTILNVQLTVKDFCQNWKVAVLI